MSLGTENNRYRYFAYIGKNSGSPDQYMRIEIKPRLRGNNPTNFTEYFSDYTFTHPETGEQITQKRWTMTYEQYGPLTEVLSFSPGDESAGFDAAQDEVEQDNNYYDTNWQVDSLRYPSAPMIFFVKAKRDRGFKNYTSNNDQWATRWIDGSLMYEGSENEFYRAGSLRIGAKFKGGSVSENKDKNWEETYGNLKEFLEEEFDFYESRALLLVEGGFTDDQYLIWRTEVKLFGTGTANEVVPYNPSADKNEKMFNTPFYFKEYDMFPEMGGNLIINPSALFGESGQDQYVSVFDSEAGENILDELDEALAGASITPVLFTEEIDAIEADPDPNDDSNFATLQREVCEPGENPEPEFEIPLEKRICPTCIPNPNYEEPSDWATIGSVWLNEATCRYSYAYRIDESFGDYSNLPAGAKGLLHSEYIREAIAVILTDRGKVVSDNIICANPPLTGGDECGPPIGPGVPLDPDPFNLTPPTIEDFLIQEQIPSGQNDGTTMSIFTLDPEAFQYNISNPTALELWARIDGAAAKVQSGPGLSGTASPTMLKITIPATLVDSLPDDTLSAEAEDNNTGLSTPGDAPANVEQAINVKLLGSTLKRTFSKVMPNLFETFSEYQSFFYHSQNGKLRQQNTNIDGSLSTLTPYYAQTYVLGFQEFYDSLVELLDKNSYNLTKRDDAYRQAYEVKIVFLGEGPKPYTIKTVKARYIGCPFKPCRKGLQHFKDEFENRQTLMAYVYESNNMLARAEPTLPPWLDFLVDYTYPALKIFYGNEEGIVNPEAESCLDNLQETETFESILDDFILDASLSFSKALEYAMNSMNCRTISEYDPSAYGKKLEDIYWPDGWSNPLVSPEIEKTLADYKSFGQGVGDISRGVNKKVLEVYDKLIRDKSNKKRNYFERLTGKTAKQTIRELRKNPKEAVGNVLRKVNPCNWEKLTLDVLRCMMKGLNTYEVLKITAKNLLGNQNIAGLQNIFVGLPIEVQTEVSAEIAEILQPVFDQLGTDLFGGDDPFNFLLYFERKKNNNNDTNKYKELSDDPQPSSATPPQVTPEDEAQALQATAEENQAQFDSVKEQIGTKQEEIITLEAAIEPPYEFENEDGTTYSKENWFDCTGSEIDEINARVNALSAANAQLDDLKQELKTARAASYSSSMAVLQQIINSDDPNVYEKAAEKIIRLVTSAYIDLIVDLLNVDQLKALVDSLPGSSVLVPLLQKAGCPHQELLETWVDAAFASIDINPCKKSSWDLPAIPTIPGLNTTAILKQLLEEFLKEIQKRLTAALVAFLARTLIKIRDLTCEIFEGVGRYLFQNYGDEGLSGNQNSSLFDAIADAFCNAQQVASVNAGDDYGSGAGTFNDLTNRYAGTIYFPPQASNDWAKALSEGMTVNQFRELFVTGNLNDHPSIDLAWEITQQFPDIAGVIQTREDLVLFFASIQNYLSDEAYDNIVETLNGLSSYAGDENVDICQIFCADLDYGVRSIPDGSPYIIDIDRYISDFSNLLRDYLNGPDGLIETTLTDPVTDPFGSDPYCEDIKDLYNSENLTGDQPLARQPDFLAQFKKDLANFVFADLEIAYIKDMIGGSDSYFNNLLADKDNKKLSRGSIFDPSHQTRVKNRFLWPNASNTVIEHDNKWNTGGFLVKLFMRIADAYNENYRNEEPPSEEDRDGFLGSFGDTVVEAIKQKFRNIFVGPFMSFVRLFTTPIPDPDSLFPKTVGIQYTIGVSESALLYQTAASTARQSTTTSTETDLSFIGWTSKNIMTFNPVYKEPDVILKYKDNQTSPSYICKSGFSNVSSTSLLNFTADSTQLEYEITAFQVFTIRPTSANFTEDVDSLQPENGMSPSAFQSFLGILDSPPADISGQEELLNYITVPYNTNLYLSQYENLKDLYRSRYGRVVLDDMTKSPQQYGLEQLILGNFNNDDRDPAANLVYGEIYIWDQFSDENEDTSWYDKVSGDIIKVLSANLLLKGADPNPMYANLEQYADSIPEGFRFGYRKNSKIEFADLFYVNPEADPNDPTTWVYTYDEEAKVLGKSATENPRVTFLSPEVYGGKYKKPYVYVKPANHFGHLGMLQAFVPEEDGCQPSREGMLFLKEIKDLIDQLEKRIPNDKRMTYDEDCVTEPPFDLISDNSSRAYLHGVTTLTVRTYVIEMFLRCAPVLMNISATPNNFDDSVSIFLLDEMEKRAKDNQYGKYKRHEYWYLLLEQMVQATEKEIILGNIEKDELLDSYFLDLKTIKQNYYQPTRQDRNVLRRIWRVSWNNNSQVERVQMAFGYGEDLDLNSPYGQKIVNMIQAVSFMAFGDNWRQYVKGEQQKKFHAGRLLSMRALRRYVKTYEIYKKRNIAKKIASYFVKREIKKFMKLYNEVKVKRDDEIVNIAKFVLNEDSNLTYGSRIKAGYRGVEIEQTIVSNEEYGYIPDVRDSFSTDSTQSKLIFNEFRKVQDLRVTNYNSYSNLSDGDGFSGFYLEKFALVTEIKESAPQRFKDIFGPIVGRKVSTELFEETVEQYMGGITYEDWDSDGDGNADSTVAVATYTTLNENLYISDLFGNAQKPILGDAPDDQAVESDSGDYYGSIGIKFGVQLSLISPGFEPTVDKEPNDQIAYSQYDKNTPIRVYKNQEDNDNVILYPLPLLEYSQDIRDRSLDEFFTEVQHFSNNLGENLKCYVDRMCEKEEFYYVMDFLLPVRKTNSLVFTNCYYGFIDSIGKGGKGNFFSSTRSDHIRERNKGADVPDEDWKTEILRTTRKKLAKLFVEYYSPRQQDSDRGNNESSEKEFKKFSLPDIYMNIDFKGLPWWIRSRFSNRPFNKNGEICMEGALGSLNQNLPAQQQSFSSNFDSDDGSYYTPSDGENVEQPGGNSSDDENT